MRISPVLLLLPVLVSSGACTQTVPSAIATDDRLVSPQPAIASPVPAPLTIKSLAGTYQPVINEQWVASYLEDVKKLGVDEATLKSSEDFVRRTYDKCKITIYMDGWFKWQDITSEKILQGRAKLDGNKLILADALGKPLPVEGIDNTTKETITFSIDVSADRKNLLLSIQTKNSSQVVRVYVKQ